MTLPVPWDRSEIETVREDEGIAVSVRTERWRRQAMRTLEDLALEAPVA